MISISKLWFKLQGEDEKVFALHQQELNNGLNVVELTIENIEFFKVTAELDSAGNPVMVVDDEGEACVKTINAPVVSDLTGTIVLELNLDGDKINSIQRSTNPQLEIVGYNVDADYSNF